MSCTQEEAAIMGAAPQTQATTASITGKIITGPDHAQLMCAALSLLNPTLPRDSASRNLLFRIRLDAPSKPVRSVTLRLRGLDQIQQRDSSLASFRLVGEEVIAHQGDESAPVQVEIWYNSSQPVHGTYRESRPERDSYVAERTAIIELLNGIG
jgi:hypothetical protein